MHRYTLTYMHTCTQRELKEKKRKAINKTTMIERAKQKCELQWSSSFFGKVSSNKVDLVRGVEECLGTSLDLQGGQSLKRLHSSRFIVWWRRVIWSHLHTAAAPSFSKVGLRIKHTAGQCELKQDPWWRRDWKDRKGIFTNVIFPLCAVKLAFPCWSMRRYLVKEK